MAKADSIESIRDSIRAETAAADEAKPIVEGWIEELAWRRQGKRMAAYHTVAWLFDCSESWVRRLLAGEVDGYDADRHKRIVASRPWLRACQVARGRALIGDASDGRGSDDALR